jgi:transcriptional regulator with XRE-family HTH domain
VESNEHNSELKALGKAIRQLRESAGLSQFKLSIEIGLSENQVGRIERGESNPTARTLFKIAKALKVDLKSLF